jgi:uncharacterized protein (TIGR00730 family)
VAPENPSHEGAAVPAREPGSKTGGVRRLCVFCGSSPGRDAVYAACARELGELLVQRGIGLVYGGARVGLMGTLADAVLQAGGEVTGVIPTALLEREIAHLGLTDLRTVGSMHERKALMADLSDGFIGLPGGLGTFEELLEIVTWAQLGMHRKPCGVLNVRGYYDGLVAFLDHAVGERFLRPEHRELLLVEATPGALLERVLAFETPAGVAKWIDRDEI